LGEDFSAAAELADLLQHLKGRGAEEFALVWHQLEHLPL